MYFKTIKKAIIIAWISITAVYGLQVYAIDVLSTSQIPSFFENEGILEVINRIFLSQESKHSNILFRHPFD